MSLLTHEVKASIEKCILCWLATSSLDNEPNVSPKEIFTHYKESIIIANIASPRSVKNISENSMACVSFLDILVQKGFQIKGKAHIIKVGDDTFDEMSKPLLAMTKGKFPFKTIIQIYIEKVKPILAPSYVFFPETKEEDQIEQARKAYGF
ncbi:MAG: pyridoxamine 5'-phosphate oxidase family protein [Bacteroidota bacterium]